jgi:DNA-binding transcriptional MerR regulator
MEYTVKKLAKTAGISVRTLHYYDQIGLLKPSFVKNNGYRCYQEKELIKLQLILFFRELEFPLSQIKIMVNSPNFDNEIALNDQRKLLEIKKDRIVRLIETIDNTIENMKNGTKINSDELYGSFSKDEMEKYKEEAKKRWGNTQAYKQSMERTKNMTKEDFKKIEAKNQMILAKIVQHMDKGASDPIVQEGIKEHFQGMQVFYDCSYEMYRNLGKMYVEDKRFTAYYDKVKPGLARFMCEAMGVFAEGKK